MIYIKIERTILKNSARSIFYVFQANAGLNNYFIKIF
jgi:hypothetical protein